VALSDTNPGGGTVSIDYVLRSRGLKEKRWEGTFSLRGKRKKGDCPPKEKGCPYCFIYRDCGEEASGWGSTQLISIWAAVEKKSHICSQRRKREGG